MNDPLKQYLEGIEAKVAQQYAETSYTDSYVALLDILGMKKLVQRPYTDLRAIFNVAESGKKVYGGITGPSGSSFIGQEHLKMTIMSDAIVLSIDCRIDHAFSKLIGFSSYLIHKFITSLDFPVFLRGGITRGQVFHDGSTVFGPALVEAYNLENEVASSMRCIISDTLHSDEAFIAYATTTTNALYKDPKDDKYFIKFAQEDNFDVLLDHAHKMLNSDESTNVKKKYKWLVNYVERAKNA